LETLNKVVELRDTMRMRGGKLKIAVQLSLGFGLVCVSLGEIRARAQGHGPVAVTLKAKPADLTVLSKNKYRASTPSSVRATGK
jgi:hypothetical protein